MREFFILKDREVVPVASLEEWALQTPIQHVGDTQIGEVRVSTVFLGINNQHSFGPPLVFETMIFGGEHNEWQERCSTWAEAEAQHAKAVHLVHQSLH